MTPGAHRERPAPSICGEDRIGIGQDPMRSRPAASAKKKRENDGAFIWLPMTIPNRTECWFGGQVFQDSSVRAPGQPSAEIRSACCAAARADPKHIARGGKPISGEGTAILPIIRSVPGRPGGTTLVRKAFECGGSGPQPRGFCAGVRAGDRRSSIRAPREIRAADSTCRHEDPCNKPHCRRAALRARGRNFVDDLDRIPAWRSVHHLQRPWSSPARGRNGGPPIAALPPRSSNANLPRWSPGATAKGQRLRHSGPPEIVLIGQCGRPSRRSKAPLWAASPAASHLIRKKNVPKAPQLKGRQASRGVATPEQAGLHHPRRPLERRRTRAFVIYRSRPRASRTIVRTRYQDIGYADAEPPISRAPSSPEVVDSVLVVGAPNSSNSNRRARNPPAEHGVPSYPSIETTQRPPPRHEWLRGRRIGWASNRRRLGSRRARPGPHRQAARSAARMELGQAARRYLKNVPPLPHAQRAWQRGRH